MPAASRRKGLLRRPTRSGGDGERPTDDDAIEAGEVEDDGGEAGAEDEAATPAGAAVATIRPQRPSASDGVDVVESVRPAGSGFRAEANDDMFCMDDPISEEVRLDPTFRKLVFRDSDSAGGPDSGPVQSTASRSVSATGPDGVPERISRSPTARTAPPGQAAPGRSDASRTRIGAVDEASNRPGSITAVRPVETPSVRPPTPPPPAAVPVSAPVVDAAPAELVSMPPQPQAAQDRRPADARADHGAVTARISADVFGTPLPTTRAVAPDLPLPRQVPKTDLAPPEPAPSRGDEGVNQGAAAGVLAIGGAAALSIGAAVTLVVVILVLVGVSWFRSPGGAPEAPVDAPIPPTEVPTPVEAVAPPPGEAPPVEETVEEAPAPASDGAPEGATSAPRRPKPKPEPEPELPPAPAPEPVAAPAPPPAPAPAPEVEDDEDKKGRKSKKKK